MMGHPALKRARDRLETAVPRLVRALPLPLLAAWATGYALWALTHRHILPLSLTNTVLPADRKIGLVFVGVSVAVACALMIGWRVYRRLRPAAPVARPYGGARALLGLPLAFPFAVAAFTPAVEAKYPIATALSIITAAVCFMAFLYGLAAFERRGAVPKETPTSPSEWLQRLAKLAPVLALGILWAAYAVGFSYASTRIIEALNTPLWDLGIYDNLLFHTSHGDILGSSIVKGNTHTTSHVDPIIIILSLFYRLHPDIHFLLVVQSLWCGAGVIPAYLLGKRHLESRWAGVAVAAVYALQPALHGANLNSFHSLTLIVPPVLFAWYFIDSGRYLRFLLTLPFIWIVREDAALLSVFIGASMLTVKDEKGRVTAALVAILLSAAYFLVVKHFFMATHDVFMKSRNAYDYSFVYEFMIPNGKGMKEYFISILTNPMGVLRFAFDTEQLSFVFKMFGPLLFIPLLARTGRLALLYGFLFLLLASHRPMHGTNVQYAMVLLPILIGLLPSGMRTLIDLPLFENRLTRMKRTFVLTLGLLACSVLFACKFGALAPNQNCIAIPRSFDKLMTEREEFISQMVEKIPPRASVVASHKLLPFVSNRMDAYVFDSARNRPKKPADFYFIDRVKLSKEESADTTLFWKRVKKKYKAVGARHGVALYRRIPDAAVPSNPSKEK
jgi:uncharacterized membrane protein